MHSLGIRQNLFFRLFKSKNWRETNKNSFCLHQFCPFWGPKTILIQTGFQIFFLFIVFWSKRKVFANLNKKYNFKGFYDYLKICGKNRRFSGIEILKVYLVVSIMPVFENRQKVLYHSTLSCSICLHLALKHAVLQSAPGSPARSQVVEGSRRFLLARTCTQASVGLSLNCRQKAGEKAYLQASVSSRWTSETRKKTRNQWRMTSPV